MRNLPRALWIASAAAFALSALAGAGGARINTTSSYPPGLYWITGAPARPGALVIACPPPVATVAAGLRRGYLGAGFCPGGYGYVIKKMLAMPGDRVAVTGQGVRVNGALVPNSAPRQADTEGRPLPGRETAYTLGPAQVLLLSDYSPGSFDGRYFGPVAQSAIKGVLRPVFTVGRPAH